MEGNIMNSKFLDLHISGFKFQIETLNFELILKIQKKIKIFKFLNQTLEF